MLKITLVIVYIYVFLLAPANGFVAEKSRSVEETIADVEETIEPIENAVELAKATDKQPTSSNFVNSKQFFLVTTEKVNWYRAAHICKFNGMELASINSMEENNIVIMLITMSGCGGESDFFWTSGNDLGAFTEWYWLADGKPMGFTNWGTGEPNNYEDRNERCAHFQWKNLSWNWNDAPCEREFFFVCEMKFN